MVAGRGLGLLRHFQRLLDECAQLLECDRLGQVVECAGLQRRDGVLGTAERGDHGYGHVERLLRDVLDDSQSLAIRQIPVGEAQVVRVAIEHPQRFADGLGARRVEAHSRQRHFEQFEQVRFVIDDQHFGLTTGFARHWMCFFERIQTRILSPIAAGVSARLKVRRNMAPVIWATARARSRWRRRARGRCRVRVRFRRNVW